MVGQGLEEFVAQRVDAGQYKFEFLLKISQNVLQIVKYNAKINI